MKQVTLKHNKPITISKPYEPTVIKTTGLLVAEFKVYLQDSTYHHKEVGEVPMTYIVVETKYEEQTKTGRYVRRWGYNCKKEYTNEPVSSMTIEHDHKSIGLDTIQFKLFNDKGEQVTKLLADNGELYKDRNDYASMFVTRIGQRMEFGQPHSKD